MSNVLLNFLSATLLFAFVSVAYAEDNWERYYSTKNIDYDVNEFTIKKDKSGNSSGWVQWHWRTPASDGTTRIKIKMNANCSAGTLWHSEAVSYDSDGNVTHSQAKRVDVTVAPDTANEATFSVLCESSLDNK